MQWDGVICFSCGDWWYHNRGHFDMQLMKRFARRTPVVYINAMGMRFPSVGEGGMFVRRITRKLRSVARGFVRFADDFYVFSPFSVPLYRRRFTRGANALSVRAQVRWAIRRAGFKRPLIWVVSPPAVDVVTALPRAALVYQRTDDFKVFEGASAGAIAAMDDALLRRADLVVHVNRGLHEQALAAGANSLLTSHGVDYELFAASPENAPEPADIAEIPRPRIGFYGGIDNHTFDPELYVEVARRLPEYQFVLVGACSLPGQTFAGLENVHLLGQKRYEEIPVYGRTFDAALMPWRQNKWIAGCNPVKLKEYLALGKPVVSTPYPEGAAYQDVVYFAAGADAFAGAIRRALAEDGYAARAARRAKVAGQTWDALAERVVGEIERAIVPREVACAGH